MPVEYVRTEAGFVEYQQIIEGTDHKLVLRAEGVRKEKTGVHAKVTIGVDTMRVDQDTFNIGRREDRTRLVNSALKSPQISELKPRIESILEHEMLMFLEGLWEFEVGRNAPEKRGGSVQRTAPPWQLKPYLLQKAGTILFAAPGFGKSWTALALAVMVDAGYKFFYEVEQGPVLFVNLERSAESVDIRLADVNAALGQPRERPLMRLDRRGRRFVDVADSVRKICQSDGIAMVVLDSLSRGGYGDLNANDDSNAAMDSLNSLGTGWLALGHTARGDATHVFGSQMQDAAADITVQLISEERVDKYGKVTLGIGLKGMKANDVRKPPLSILAYEFDELGLVGIRKPRPGEFLTIENESVGLDMRSQVSSYIRQEGAATATAIARDTGLNRSKVSALLASGPEFSGERKGREVVYRVVDPVDVLPRNTSGTTGQSGSVVPNTSLREHNTSGSVVPHVLPRNTSIRDENYPFDDDAGRLDSLAGM